MEMTFARRHLPTQSLNAPNSALAQVTYAGDKPAVPAAGHALGHVRRRSRYASLAALPRRVWSGPRFERLAC